MFFFVVSFDVCSWIKPGAVVIDVGINSVDDPTSKKGIMAHMVYIFNHNMVIYITHERRLQAGGRCELRRVPPSGLPHHARKLQLFDSLLVDNIAARIQYNCSLQKMSFFNKPNLAVCIFQVPGGVGPMTIAMLLRNTVNGCRRTAQQAQAAAAATTIADAASELPTPPAAAVAAV